MLAVVWPRQNFSRYHKHFAESTVAHNNITTQSLDTSYKTFVVALKGLKISKALGLPGRVEEY